MDERQAVGILKEADFIKADGRLYNLGAYLAWHPTDNEATLDGQFSADELEAIVWWMRNKGAK